MWYTIRADGELISRARSVTDAAVIVEDLGENHLTSVTFDEGGEMELVMTAQAFLEGLE